MEVINFQYFFPKLWYGLLYAVYRKVVILSGLEVVLF